MKASRSGSVKATAEGGWFAYMHSCGGIAFYLDHKPGPFERVTTKGLFHKDGRPILSATRPTCDSCGQFLTTTPTLKAIAPVKDPSWAGRWVRTPPAPAWPEPKKPVDWLTYLLVLVAMTYALAAVSFFWWWNAP